MKKRTDKRLLSSLDHIDNKFTERAAERIKTRQVGMTGGVSKKRLIKQITLIAACFLMLVAAIPLVTTLVNKLPDYYAPSASNDSTSEAEIPPEATLPEEYFNKVYFATPNGVFEYEGQFVYYVNDSEDQYYGNIVKYDPETDRVSSICLDASCSHTPGECILAVPGIEYWDINYMEVFGDWLIYNYTDIGGVSVEFGTTVRLYNMKTGEAQIALETITTDNITKYCKGYLVMDDKVYLNIGEISEEQCSVSVNREYIVSYDPKTQETVYMCEEPEGLGFIGISNKRFFFNKGVPQRRNSELPTYCGKRYLRI